MEHGKSTIEKYLSECIIQYPHIGNICSKPEYIIQPTNKYINVYGVSEWFNNAIYQPISTNIRPGAAIKYLVYSVINCLSGRLLKAEYPDIDPYFAINRESYNQVYSKYCKLLFPTDGQVKLGIILLNKFAELKSNMDTKTGTNQMSYTDNNLNLKKFLCEEFFNYLTPNQLLFIQCVLGSQTVTGHTMWHINNTTTTLFNTPIDMEYKFITNTRNQQVVNCSDTYKQYYISMSICALFNHIDPSINLTLRQFYDAINILDMPCSLTEQVNNYLRILTPEQSNIAYL